MTSTIHKDESTLSIKTNSTIHKDEPKKDIDESNDCHDKYCCMCCKRCNE